ncbi:MAG: ABC transporter substrate-binding protein [Deferrisomatales bacterium]|nr:ABC transporter substrate-binding protein [Deferrisomatales bacterium]
MGDRSAPAGDRRSVEHPLLRWLALAATGLLAAGAVGCSGKPSAPDEATSVRLVTWRPNQPEVWDEVFARFEAENPDLKVVREIGPHSSTAFHALLTQKLKNQSADVDVFLMDVIWPPEFGSAGWALALDERFSPEEREAFLPGAILANTYEARVYGVPLFLASGMLYYRKDLLAQHGFEPPETWAEMVEQAAVIVARATEAGEELHGFSGQFKQYEGLVCDMLEFILSRGGHAVDPRTGRSALAEEPALEAVRFVRDRIIGGSAPRGVLTYAEPESLDLFVQGKAVFHRNWPYAWEVANDPEKSRVAGRVGLSVLPRFPEGESTAILGGWQVGVSPFSRNPDAAWRLVSYLTGFETQKLLAIRAGLAPTRRAVYEDPEVLAAQPHLGAMAEVFATAHPRPRTPLYPAVSNVLQRYFSTAIADRSSDLERLAREASAEVDRLLDLAR